MATDSFKVKKSLNIEPKASPSLDSEGDIGYNSTSKKLEVRDDSATQSLVTEAGTATLTNKTIDGASNTITNIPGDSVDLSDSTAIDIATSNTASTINIGTGTDTNTINIGGANTTINMTGTVNSQNVTNLEVADKLITLNNGGAAASGAVSGIEIEENGSATGYIKTSADRDGWEIKAPNVSGTVSIEPEASVDQEVVLTSKSQTVSNKTLLNSTLSGTTQTGETGSRVLVTDASGFLDSSSVTTTELGRLSGIGSTAVGTSDSNVLSNKTFSDPIVLDGQGSTPATPSAGFYKMYVSDSSQKLTIMDSNGVETAVGSGSGGGVNYILTPDGSSSVGWATYSDGGASPTDGTGGSPTISYATSTNSDLRGSSNFLFTHSASNQQGQGFSYNFTIDAADKAKVLTVSFNYLVASGTYADGDLTVWIYDVTNATLIQPAPYKILNAIGSQPWQGEFQTASNSTSYRLIVHVTTSTATAYTMRFDNFALGPDIGKNMGVPVTDWVSYTPTLTGSGSNPSLGSTGTISGMWRRVGDTMECTLYAVASGTGVTNGSGYYQFSIPSGYSIDGSKTKGTFGTAKILNASVSYYDGVVVYGTSTAVRLLVNNAGDLVGQNVPAANWLSAGDDFQLTFSVPITGWSSNTVMSSDAATNVVAAVTGSASAVTLNGSVVSILGFSGKGVDTNNGITLETGSFTASTGQWTTNPYYTVPVAGYYRVHATVHRKFTTSNASNTHLIAAYVNGVSASGHTGNADAVNNGGLYFYVQTLNDILVLKAGDKVDIRVSSDTANGVTDARLTHFSMERISGPAQIAASSVVAAKANKNGANQTIAPNASFVKITWPALNFDKTGSFDTANSRYITPMPGVYNVSASVWIQGTNVLANGYFITVYYDGAEISRGQYVLAASGNQLNLQVTAKVDAVAGKAFEIYVYGYGNNSVSTLTVDGTNSLTYFELERLGGVM